MRTRGRAAALAGCLIAVSAPAVAAPEGAVPDRASGVRITQPYRHLVAVGEWGSGGSYVSNGGAIVLTLTTVPHTVRVFAEGCSSPDLGRTRTYPADESTRHVLARDVPAGTCFLLLFRDPSGNGGFLVEGKLRY